MSVNAEVDQIDEENYIILEDKEQTDINQKIDFSKINWKENPLFSINDKLKNTNPFEILYFTPQKKIKFDTEQSSLKFNKNPNKNNSINLQDNSQYFKQETEKVKSICRAQQIKYINLDVSGFPLTQEEMNQLTEKQNSKFMQQNNNNQEKEIQKLLEIYTFYLQNIIQQSQQSKNSCSLVKDTAIDQFQDLNSPKMCPLTPRQSAFSYSFSSYQNLNPLQLQKAESDYMNLRIIQQQNWVKSITPKHQLNPKISNILAELSSITVEKIESIFQYLIENSQNLSNEKIIYEMKITICGSNAELQKIFLEIWNKFNNYQFDKQELILSSIKDFLIFLEKNMNKNIDNKREILVYYFNSSKSCSQSQKEEIDSYFSFIFNNKKIILISKSKEGIQQLFKILFSSPLFAKDFISYLSGFDEILKEKNSSLINRLSNQIYELIQKRLLNISIDDQQGVEQLIQKMNNFPLTSKQIKYSRQVIISTIDNYKQINVILKENNDFNSSSFAISKKVNKYHQNDSQCYSSISEKNTECSINSGRSSLFTDGQENIQIKDEHCKNIFGIGKIKRSNSSNV